MGIAERVAEKIVNNHFTVVENRLCLRFRTPKSACSICADVCPVDVILISEKGAEIRGGCIDCGVCLSACPNGVFRINGRDDNKIIGEIREIIKEARAVRISCEHGDSSADLIVTCLSRLTETLLMELLRLGTSGIELLQPSCKKCPSKKAAPHIDRVIQRTHYIYEMLGKKSGSISVISTEFREQRSSKLTTQDTGYKTISRREFLGSIRSKAMEAAAVSIPDVENEDNGTGQLFREAIRKRPENLKRAMLLESIRDIGSKVKNQGLEVSSSDSIIAELEINSKCTACGVCAILCPTGAIIQQWTEDHYSLSYRPDLCTNCKGCVDACMPQAIRIKEKASLNLLLEQTEINLFEVGKKRCPVCRMDFIGGESEICPLCINIHNKQMAAIQNMFRKGG